MNSDPSPAGTEPVPAAGSLTCPSRTTERPWAWDVFGTLAASLPASEPEMKQQGPVLVTKDRSWPPLLSPSPLSPSAPHCFSVSVLPRPCPVIVSDSSVLAS